MSLHARLRLSRGGLRLELELTAERTLVLAGPNGAGKTTILLMLLGVLEPEDGRIELGGRPLFDRSARIDLPVEHRRIGYLPQDAALFPHLSALENVAFGLLARGSAKAAALEQARSTLNGLGIEELALRHPSALSGGERQKVALARALAITPQALLLDEPFASLDVDARAASRAFLREKLEQFGRPALVVSHDAADVAALNAPVAIVEAGRIVQTGTLQQIRGDPRSPYARNFTREET